MEMQKQIRSLQKSPAMNVISIIGWLMAGALVVPVLYGLLSAAPDFVRYMKMRSM